jgi:hypothetical protein
MTLRSSFDFWLIEIFPDVFDEDHKTFSGNLSIYKCPGFTADHVKKIDKSAMFNKFYVDKQA